MSYNMTNNRAIKIKRQFISDNRDMSSLAEDIYDHQFWLDREDDVMLDGGFSTRSDVGGKGSDIADFEYTDNLDLCKQIRGYGDYDFEGVFV